MQPTKLNATAPTRRTAERPKFSRSSGRVRVGTMSALFGALFAAMACTAENRAAAFDQANKLYEQNRFAEAAAAYERLLTNGSPTPTLYFNLGNARFKAGQIGQAVAAYLRGQELAPRDPHLRFNLQFVRRQVSGREGLPGRWWQRALRSLTLNEWTVLASVGLGLWFVLLTAREWRGAWRKPLRGYTATTGVVALLLTVTALAATQDRRSLHRAVVIVPDAPVRIGPLDDAREAHKFRNGTEAEVVDSKIILAGSGSQLWLQVQDAAGRTGWLKREQVVRVDPEIP